MLHDESQSDKLGHSSAAIIRYGLVSVFACLGGFFLVVAVRKNTAARAIAWMFRGFGLPWFEIEYQTRICLFISVACFVLSFLSSAFGGYCQSSFDVDADVSEDRSPSIFGRKRAPVGHAAVQALRDPPFVRRIGKGEWTIHGVSEAELLKCGLRRLDQTWPVAGLLDLPLGEGKTTALLRRNLVADLLANRISVWVVSDTDINAAEHDLRLLTLRQLLRLRVLHLTAESDKAFALSQQVAHKDFIATLDRHLFERLGIHFVGPLLTSAAASSSGTAASGNWKAPASSSSGSTDELYRYGLEAALLTAAAATIPEHQWWVWWLDDERRVFFDSVRSVAALDFPDEGEDRNQGVLELLDTTKCDGSDPTGRHRQLDWRATLISEEAGLSQTPRRISATETNLDMSPAPADAGATKSRFDRQTTADSQHTKAHAAIASMTSSNFARTR
eukprot:TRINITY_DN24699_c0_g2_i2.p1 TRINITY_DN24699_c0_g2~~TRINITY_DN24699_c0_g2_i2.p1  ORF type:complete len:446 (-),score=83.54 TRINITY_DN24699_c0_g2_i2:96-1433(-)